MSAVADPPTPAPAPVPVGTRRGLRARLVALRDRVAAVPHLETVAWLVLLVLCSYYLRTQAITAKLWIDEGLSIGIAHHDFWDIPRVLQQDGSPPLYYLLLHVWMSVVGGDGEARTHALSLLFTLLMVPAGWWTGRRLFGTRAGWATAALCATCPFVTYYAQETRMYALVMLMGLLASGTFAMAYALRDRRAVPLFSVSCALLIYSHNWGLFLTAGLVAAFVLLWRTTPAPHERRALLRDGLLGFGAVAVLYLPWVPTLVQQARETAAPWSDVPRFEQILDGLQQVSGGTQTSLAAFVVGAAGLVTLRRRREDRARWRAAVVLFVAFVVGILLAWLASQVSPAWAGRYFAPFAGPALLMLGGGMTRFGKVGLVALALVLVLWFDPRESTIRGKSDAFRVARTLDERGLIAAGDTVLTIHPEQGPLMRYYLGPDLRYFDAMGRVPDTRVFDWRDALDRLTAAKPVRTWDTIAPQVAVGRRVVMILPIIRTSAWGAPWTSLVRERSAQWSRAVNADPRFLRIAGVPDFTNRGLPRGVRAVVFLRVA